MHNYFKIIIVIIIIISPSPVWATEMTGKKTRINLNFKTQTSSYSAVPGSTGDSKTAINQEGESLPAKELYSISLGYSKTNRSPLAIEISPKSLDFGELNPTSAVTRSQSVSVQRGPSPMYSLYISENHPPTDASESGKFIPNTTGDKDKVTVSKSGYWINPLTYGFGYYAKSKQSIITGFEKEDVFKQFASLENGLPREPLLKNSDKDEDVTIIIKMNINNNQSNTTYQNDIYYTLVPSL
jgi:hypothetical protein